MSQVARVAFMGTPAFAVPALEVLAVHAALKIVAVYTQPDRPAGRGRRLQVAAVKQRALQLGLPCRAPTRLRQPEALADWVALDLDLAVVAAYGRILPPDWLAASRLGCCNLHASLLPQYRGAAPIAHAIWAGETHTGVSLMRMDAGLDTGPVYSRASLPIAPADTCGTLTEKLAALGASCLGPSLPQLLAGQLPAVAQAELPRLPEQSSVAVSLAPPLLKAAGALDFAQDAAYLARQVRALSPWPGTFVAQATPRLGVLRAHAAAASAAGTPGSVLYVGPRGVEVACQTGSLWLDEVKPAGGRAMTATAWAAGRRVVVGAPLWTAV